MVDVLVVSWVGVDGGGYVGRIEDDGTYMTIATITIATTTNNHVPTALLIGSAAKTLFIGSTVVLLAMVANDANDLTQVKVSGLQKPPLHWWCW